MEAAINSRQWKKAVQILELQDSAMAARYYKKIADHYASVGEYKVCPSASSIPSVINFFFLHLNFSLLRF